MTSTTTEWGVRRIWPDGHSETKHVEDRVAAEYVVRSTNHNDENPALARLVSRQVTRTDWAEVI